MDKIPTVYYDFKDLFTKKEGKDALTAYQLQDYKIPIKPREEVLFGPIYQLTQSEQGTLKQYIKDSLKKGQIKESKLLAGSLVLFVPKLDRLLQLYIDYQKLNAVTIKDRYTILLVQEL